MGDKWKDLGRSEGIIESAIGSVMRTHDHLVENKETGEKKEVYVVGNQSVSEAISKGQFKK